MGVSKNKGFNPKSSILIGFGTIIFTIHFGGFTTPIFGSTFIIQYKNQYIFESGECTPESHPPTIPSNHPNQQNSHSHDGSMTPGMKYLPTNFTLRIHDSWIYRCNPNPNGDLEFRKKTGCFGGSSLTFKHRPVVRWVL